MSTLIAYGSNRGITKDIAILLSNKLNSEVDVRNIKHNSSFYIDKYENILMGINLVDGKISNEVNKFIENNIEDLKFKKLGFFTVNKDKNQVEFIDENLPQEFKSLISFKENLEADKSEQIESFTNILNNNLVESYIY